MNNPRFEALKREANEIEKQLKNQGCCGAEIEIIGALLFVKYQGKEKELSKLLENTTELLQKAKDLLQELRALKK